MLVQRNARCPPATTQSSRDRGAGSELPAGSSSGPGASRRWGVQRFSHRHLSCLTILTRLSTLPARSGYLMRRFRAPVPFKDRPMKMRWLLVVVLIGLLFVLSPMAFARPPDPSWLGGFWDDADFHGVILHLTWRFPALPSGQPSFDRHEDPLPGSSSFSHDTRAPPAS